MALGVRNLFLAAVAAAFFYLPTGADAQSNRWLPREGHMTVHFSIDHGGLSLTRGTFRELSGELILDPSKPEAAQLSIKINATSFDTAHYVRDNAVRAVFLKALKNPSITFKSTKIVKTGDKTGKVTGDLTMIGVTKPVTLDVTFNKAAKRPSGEDYYGFSATASINRLDWGINAYSSKSPPAVTGEVIDIEIAAEFVRQK